MPVPHYYFDIRDGKALAVDEEGLNLTDHRAAEVEAALSAHFAWSASPPHAEPARFRASRGRRRRPRARRKPVAPARYARTPSGTSEDS
ncbi:DUF6894 family protein [Bradyrhizobium liaoningense]|uniref:DUF6894 family protein n=1 Tax=Bradyrhizobium liaoningense TaxID=43992 RepID=UPI003D9B8D5E